MQRYTQSRKHGQMQLKTMHSVIICGLMWLSSFSAGSGESEDSIRAMIDGMKRLEMQESDLITQKERLEVCKHSRWSSQCQISA